MNRVEQKIQTAIVVALRRQFDCFAFHVPNGGVRTHLEAIAFKDAGATAGVPDIVVNGPGALVAYLEIKAKVQVRERSVAPLARLATLDPAQKQVAGRLRKYALPVAVVDCVEDAVAVCELLGFPPKPPAAPRSEAAMSTGF